MIVIYVMGFLFIALCSSFFSGVETGLISINTVSLRERAGEKNTSVRFIIYLVDNIEEFLTVSLIGNNIANVILSVIATNEFLPFFIERFGNTGGKLIMSGCILTPFILLFGEILPKEIFRQKADILIFKLNFLLKVSYYILYIPARILMKTISIFLPRFDRNTLFITKEELEHLISISDKSGALDPGQKKMMEGIFDLSSKNAKEIMTPRVNMKTLSMDTPLKEVIDEVNENGHSRIPVYSDNPDNIAGFIFVLDIIHDPEVDIMHGTLEKYLREVTFVPETKSVDELFTEMKTEKHQIRMVVDEHGQVSGLITLEDIIEEIVGEIHDEYDDDIVDSVQAKDGSIVVDGQFSVEELNEKYGLDFPEEEDFETLTGLIEHITGEIPREGQIIEWNAYRFIILARTGNSIEKVRLIVPDYIFDDPDEEKAEDRYVE
ncbi:MAG: hemolysin family protein [Candidatus Muiribacteriaceae bacterium]